MPLLDGLGLPLPAAAPLDVGPTGRPTPRASSPAGDAHRGASLIVWAIAEGRSVANAVDSYLTGSSELPSPVQPNLLPLAVV